MFRIASLQDLPAIAAIYDDIHSAEEAGPRQVGWIRSIYPTRDTARSAIEAGEMYVLEKNGSVVAAGKINKEQMPAYAQVNWQHEAEDEQVMVLHTLVVSPKEGGKGYGSEFVAEYEAMALQNNCPFLRIDTNAINRRARSMYKKLGYMEAGIIPCVFCGIPNVNLVCLEKRLPVPKNDKNA